MPQLLQFDEHREHALELAVEMNLVAGKPFEPVRIDGFAKCLSPDQRPMIQFSAAETSVSRKRFRLSASAR